MEGIQMFYDENLFSGLWVEDETRNMWIIPDAVNSGGMGIEGPDIPQIIDKLYQIRSDNGGIVERRDVEKLGLFVVDDCLKRYNEIDGYYHA
jgi:hypothetical protein